MAQSVDKNILIKWLVLLGDVLTYVVLVNIVAFKPADYIPVSISSHVGIAATMGALCIVLFSVIFPTLIYRRIVDFKEIVIRNAAVAFFSQLCFAHLWHLITVNSANEVSFNTIIAVLMFVTMVLLRFLEKGLLGYMRSIGYNRRMVLFVGSDPANLAIYRELLSDPATGYYATGYYSDNDMEDAPENLKKLGTRQEFMRLIAENSEKVKDVDEIYCSLSHKMQEDIQKIKRFCDKRVIHFYYVPRIFYSKQMSMKPELVGQSVVFTSYYEPLSSLSNRVVKRLFDVSFSLCVLICMLPLLPIIYVVVKTQSPGPLFFKQKRTGMNGDTFMCYKFRSMHINEDADQRQATENDERKFPFGDFMRRTNIDELPQFFNVLVGDMSVVGPRPHMTLHTEQYSSLIEKYMVRHFAKPGITGWAQITGYRGETKELWQMEGRIQKDIWYIEHWSFWLDIKICAKTAVSIIIPDKNAY